MDNMFHLPQSRSSDPVQSAMDSIEKRFNVCFWDYVGVNGKRSNEVQKKINRALKKETMKIASKIIKQ